MVLHYFYPAFFYCCWAIATNEVLLGLIKFYRITLYSLHSVCNDISRERERESERERHTNRPRERLNVLLLLLLLLLALLPTLGQQDVTTVASQDLDGTRRFCYTAGAERGPSRDQMDWKELPTA